MLSKNQRLLEASIRRWNLTPSYHRRGLFVECKLQKHGRIAASAKALSQDRALVLAVAEALQHKRQAPEVEQREAIRRDADSRFDWRDIAAGLVAVASIALILTVWHRNSPGTGKEASPSSPPPAELPIPTSRVDNVGPLFSTSN